MSCGGDDTVTIATRSAAASHVGKVRANNQDSGYAGRGLFIVADGMGGHAGGDVASAIVVNRMREADVEYPSVDDAEFSLASSLVAANQLLGETVYDHPELTGMGTTASALAFVDDRIALAHIGDSRVYRYRDGELAQITKDHTFVQRLVDSGRITPEEALVHPRRSVLMRVLGDVDGSPEIDTEIFEAVPGDRWLLCSDGLSSYVDERDIVGVLERSLDPQSAADALVKITLDHGAPDNVTVVVIDVVDGEPENRRPVTVGSAEKPLDFGPDHNKRTPTTRIPTLLRHPIRTHNEEAHEEFVPEQDDYIRQLIHEDHQREIRRRVAWIAGIILVLGLIFGGGAWAYNWSQSRYYVGEADGVVTIYQGVQQDLGPVKLSHVYEKSNVKVSSLSSYEREQVRDTISAGTLSEAEQVVDRLKHG